MLASRIWSDTKQAAARPEWQHNTDSKMDRDTAIRRWALDVGQQTSNCGGHSALDITLGRGGTTGGSSSVCERKVLGGEAGEGDGARRRQREVSSLHSYLTINAHDIASTGETKQSHDAQAA